MAHLDLKNGKLTKKDIRPIVSYVKTKDIEHLPEK